MIHGDIRRAALERWLGAQLPASFTLSPASEDASFRRYFRAALDDGRSFIAMDAPPEKEDCRPFVQVAGLLHDAGVHAPRVEAQDLAQGFLLLTDLGNRTYLQELDPAERSTPLQRRDRRAGQVATGQQGRRAAGIRRSAAAARDEPVP
jgi:aminoglycoside/choline kinase family phosphotransferase